MNHITFFSANGVTSEEDLSSPEDETAGSFHTPKHASVIGAGSTRSVLASQDSIDVFHDAYSTFNAPQKFKSPLSPPPHTAALKVAQRRRHFSSGAKFEEEKDREELSTVCDWEETDEQTCMLPKCPVTRVRHASQGPGPGQTSRSCNGSPFHVPRLSVSTNSLKRKSMDKMSLSNSPQKQSAINQGNSITNYVPCVEVEMIKETDEGEIKTDNNSTPLLNEKTDLYESNTPEVLSENTNKPLQKNNQNHDSLGNRTWSKNYVPCAEVNSLYNSTNLQDCKGETQIIQQEPQKFYSSKSIRRKRKIWQVIKEEFTLTNFRFNHKTPHMFVTSQWQQPYEMCCMYLAYRLFWGVYFTMWSIWSWVGFAGYSASPDLKGYYLIFLTNWGIWLLAFDTMLQAVNVGLHIKKISKEGEAKYSVMKTTFKVSWALSTMTSTLHIFITIFFWTLVYPKSTNRVNEISVNTHIIPCLYVILDCFISATPRRVFHAYLPMSLLTIYGIFTDIYYLFGGTNHHGNLALYPLLDWSEQFKTLLIGSGIILLLIPFIHTFVVCILYGLRVKLWRNLNYTRYMQERRIDEAISMEEKV